MSNYLNKKRYLNMESNFPSAPLNIASVMISQTITVSRIPLAK